METNTESPSAGAKPRTHYPYSDCGDCAGMPPADFTDRSAVNERCRFCQRLFNLTVAASPKLLCGFEWQYAGTRVCEREQGHEGFHAQWVPSKRPWHHTGAVVAHPKGA